MGKYRSFVMFGIAIFLALIATVLIVNWLQTKAKGREAPTLQTQEVTVSKVDLKWGTVLTREMLETKPFLKNSLPGGYSNDPSSLVGRVIISTINANEPILESKLAPTTLKTGGVAAVVTPKKRAVSIKVDKVIGVSGFIHPGNRVDVLVTIQLERSQTPITKVVLENIPVLAAGPETETKGKEEKASPVEVITLEVTPEEAEKLALSVTEGKILLVLRNFSDTEDVVTKGMTIPALLASYSSNGPSISPKKVIRKAVASKKPVLAPVPEKQAPPIVVEKIVEKKVEIEKPVEQPPKPVFVVELIKGSKMSEVKFERGE